jgi:hypothetical protein
VIACCSTACARGLPVARLVSKDFQPKGWVGSMRNLSLRTIFTFSMGVALMVGCGGTLTQEDDPASEQVSHEPRVHALNSLCHGGDGCDPYNPFCCIYIGVGDHYSCYGDNGLPCSGGASDSCPAGTRCVIGYGGAGQCFGNGYACENDTP